MVLVTDFCTFLRKREMLKKFMKSKPKYFAGLEADSKKLLTDLKALMEERNKFAHRDLFFVGHDYSMKFRRYDGGAKYDPITEQSWSDFLESAFRCRETLEKLNSRVQPGSPKSGDLTSQKHP